MLIEIVVWLDANYKNAQSIYVHEEMSREEITEAVNKKFGVGEWYYYDVVPY